MQVHIFGAASSPGCANYGMKHLANKNEKNYPLAAAFIRKNFYVDDSWSVSILLKGPISLLVKHERSAVRDTCIYTNLSPTTEKFWMQYQRVNMAVLCCHTERNPINSYQCTNHWDFLLPTS